MKKVRFAITFVFAWTLALNGVSAAALPLVAQSDWPAQATAGSTYYVDFESGNDASNGLSQTSAWKHAPGDPAATGAPASVALQPGDTVLFKGGVVYRGRVNINANGAAGAPITYRGDGWGTGRAIIDGSEILTGTWTSCTSQTACGGNPHWANIYYLDTARSMSVFTPLYEGSEFLWFAQDPNQPDPFWFDDLNHYRVIPRNSPTITATRTSLTDPTYFTQSDPNYWNGTYVAVWVSPNVVSVQPITGYDPAAHKVTFAELEGTIYTDRDSYYSVINHVMLIDRAGEYAFDAAAHRLYLWPLGADPAQAEISIGERGRGFDLRGHSHIVLEGFRMQRFFGDLGAWYQGVAVYNETGTGQDITIRNNEMIQSRSMVGAAPIELRNVNGVIVETNNVDENQKNSGIRFLSAENVVVKNNIVRKIGRTGIMFMGVHHSQILNNTIHEILGTHGNGMSIYESCSEILVAGNRIYDSTFPLTFENSSDLTFFNNIIDAGGGENNIHEWGTGSGGTIAFLNNVLVRNSRNAALDTGDGGAVYVFRNNIIDGGPVLEATNRSHNIYTGLAWWQHANYGWSLAEGEVIEEDLSAIFVDPDHGDFRLRAGSRAIDAGVDATPYLPVALFPDYDFGVDSAGNQRPQGAAWDIGAYEFYPELALYGSPGNRALYLHWTVNTTLPVTSTWRITAYSQTLTLPLTVTGILSPTRATTLTGLTNYQWYTVTLDAMVDSTSIMSDTVRVMPTDRFVYLPLVRGE